MDCCQTNAGRMLLLVLLLFLVFSPVFPQSTLLDDFEVLQGWKAVTSEGAKLVITSGPGKSGNALVMDFDLTGAYGYVIARKDFAVDLPSNYQCTFDLRAEAPVNNFEFKFIDSLENVWWIKKLNVQYPRDWIKQRIKKRHITFAWGPSGGGDIRRVKAIEFVVSSGTGGKGRVYIDNFRFEPIDDDQAVKVRASLISSAGRGGVLDAKGSVLRKWKGEGRSDSLAIHFGYAREIGGLVIDWDKNKYATAYDVQLSDDGEDWTTVFTVTHANGSRDYVYLNEQEGRFLKLVCRTSNTRGYSILKLEVKGPGFGASSNSFFSEVAREQPRGLFPKYFLQQQCFWTIVGTMGDTKEALVNEVGTVETDQGSFSLEPFLFVDNKLITWNDVTSAQSLERGYLPIPTVEWKYKGLKLAIRAFSAGTAGNSMLLVTYRVENAGGKYPGAKLFIAFRPFQVNPPWQSLNRQGGVSHIENIRLENGVLHADSITVIPLKQPAGFGAAAFADGDVTEYLARGHVPPSKSARDIQGFASGAIEYDLDVHSGTAREFHLVVPFHSWKESPTPSMDEGSADLYVNLALASTVSFWEAKLDRFQVTLPASDQQIVNTVKSNLAYIFINQDGPRIQPGSRSYERSWIRDGSLTSTALLQMGVQDEVRAYIDWYATYQFPSGKVPCVVDTRGGDPTNEHDSHGEFIYLIMQYFRYSRDTSWLRGKFENVVKAVRFIQGLRAERKTDLYKNGTPEQRACYGLVPESISHEGYSAHPMHSYWDDFFILRGLKDATTIAQILGDKKREAEFSAETDDFRKDLYASIRLAMKNKNIAYIPGCAELGDFDATSTTIAVNPVNELGNIPEPQLHNTFDRYFDYFTKRRDGLVEWKDYTPYEARVIGTFVYLGQKERARATLDFFMKDRRPAAWNQWAEVVHRDPSAPKYIGDMPHTWVGSDFIRSVRAMFVYEREQDDALVVGAGIPERWVDERGVSVKALPTYFGALTYSMNTDHGAVVADISGTIAIPKGMIVLVSPRNTPLKSVRVNGAEYSRFNDREVVIEELPAKVELRY